jgi:hypothetical protein
LKSVKEPDTLTEMSVMFCSAPFSIEYQTLFCFRSENGWIPCTLLYMER